MFGARKVNAKKGNKSIILDLFFARRSEGSGSLTLAMNLTIPENSSLKKFELYIHFFCLNYKIQQ